MSEQLRQTILAEEQIQASKRRFGLFSQPPPLAVGDNSKFRQVQIPRGQNGKPITSPPQLLAGVCKTGQTKTSYFGAAESIYQKDPFTQPYKRDIQYERQMHTRAKFHENEFKPSAGPKILDKPAYKYVEEKPDTKPKIRKDENGRVKTEPRNFTTNPISKVETEFFKHNKHMPDPYNRKHDIQKQDHSVWKSKLQQNTWKSCSHGNNLFQKSLITYGEDETTKKMIQSKKNRSTTISSSVNHEAAFKPSVRGHGDPLDKYPRFIEPKAPIESQRKQRIKTEGVVKQKWKHNTYLFTRPTPSILMHPKNLKVNRSRYK